MVLQAGPSFSLDANEGGRNFVVYALRLLEVAWPPESGIIGHRINSAARLSLQARHHPIHIAGSKESGGLVCDQTNHFQEQTDEARCP